MARLKTQRGGPTLGQRDLALAVFGPWDPRADCGASPTPLHHPRVDADRLRAIWALHGRAIEAAADEAGVDEPWILARLDFCDAVGGPLDPRHVLLTDDDPRKARHFELRGGVSQRSEPTDPVNRKIAGFRREGNPNIGDGDTDPDAA